MRENRPQNRLEHVMRREETTVVRGVVVKMNMEGRIERRKPKKRLSGSIKNDARGAGVCVGNVDD